MRAGAFALSLLSTPLNVDVLRALEQEPISLIELRRNVGLPPQTTMRGYLRTLTEVGAIERHRPAGTPGPVGYSLAKPGLELLGIADVLAVWLESRPEKPLELGSTGAKGAIKALVDGWSSALVRAIAARPLTLTELDGLITTLNYPSLERRLAAMKMAGLIEARRASGRRKPYTVAPWLRHAIGPLLAAALWERERLGSAAASLARIDAEATFLLTMPALELPAETSGTCRFVVELPGSAGVEPAGAQVVLRDGGVESCISRLRGDPDAIVSGSGTAWLRSTVRDDPVDLEVRGDWSLADAVLHGLRRFLYGSRAAQTR